MRKLITFVSVLAVLTGYGYINNSIASDISITEASAEEIENDENILTTGECGENAVYSFDSETGVLTISGTGDMYEYSNVKSDEPSPFLKNENIKKVIIEDGITGIGADTFKCCSGIEEVIFPDTVTYIGSSSFIQCTSLSEITIPESVEKVGNWAFYDCTGLTKVTIPDNSMKIEALAFGNCSSLEELIIPDSVNARFDVFDGCTGLKVLKIPGNITSLESYTSFDCSALESFIIGKNLSQIDIRVFSQFGQLKEIKVSEENADYKSVDGILYDKSGETLLCCPQKKSDITFTENVMSIGEKAFYKCAGIKELEFPVTIKYIGKEAFSDCTSITNVTALGNINTINEKAFANCTDLSVLNFLKGLSFIKKDAFENCRVMKEIYLPLNLISIENNALGYYRSLQTGNTEKNYNLKIYGYKDSYAYEYADMHGLGFCELSYENNNENIIGKCGDDAVYSMYTDDTLIISGTGAMYTNVIEMTEYIRNNSNITNVVIDEGITSVAAYAFNDCTGLNNIMIADSVTYIGSHAFDGCRNLNSVTMSKNIQTIGSYAFSDCTYLGSIVIPDSIKYINEYTFRNCMSLNYVKLSEETYSIGKGAFSNCLSLQTIVIPDSVKMISAYAFHGCASLYNVILSENIYSIDDDVFSECTSLEEITIPDNVAYIGICAFESCTALENIIIPDSVCQINRYAFLDTKWYDMQPDGVVYAGKVAYCYKGEMPSGTYLELKPDTKGIADYAFFKCEKLTGTELPTGLECIGISAFEGCTGMNEITVPASVKTMKDYSLGYEVSDGFIMYVYPYSEAERFAKSNGINFDYIFSDINNDGEITTGDALGILNALISVTEFTDEEKKLADLDGDGEITTYDVLIMLKYIVGIDN
ncbi:MAG: leucine-rich repeat protein [Oscillospiraceae bacterium]